MKTILFVCTGNTCRSPMAEIMLKKKLKLAGIDGIKVSSAGLCANVGDRISPEAAQALRIMGYRLYAFKSKRADGKTLIKSDIVICMTERHKRAISAFPNVYTVKEITGVPDVPDPYGYGIREYVETSCVLEDVCNIILNKIIEGELFK